MNKEVLAEQAERKVKVSEFFLLLLSNVDEYKLSLGWIEGEKIGCYPGGNSGDRGLKLIDDKREVFRHK